MAGVAGQNVRAELYEDTTFSVAGTPVVPRNRNRFSSNVSDATVTHGPTITLVGTTLFVGFIPAGSGNKPPAGDLSSFEEWILLPNTVYLLRLVNNLENSATPATVSVNFYEPGAA
jgi:hypothetical protein